MTGLTIRNVWNTDIWQIFEWANDLDAIKNSRRRKGEIGAEEHKTWFYKRLKLGKWWMAKIGNVQVGVVRLDEADEEGVNGEGVPLEISVFVAPAHRGKGIGGELVKYATRRALEEGRGVRAWVKRGNYASCAIFERLGYESKFLLYVKEAETRE